MKTGDLVRWINPLGFEPMAIIIDTNYSHPDHHKDYHSRIRVHWVDRVLPPQARVTSVSGSRTSAWHTTKDFEIVSQIKKEGNT